MRCKPTDWDVIQGEKCKICGKRAEISLIYGPHHYCKQHFLYLTEKRVKRTIRKYSLIKPGEKILLTMSGGKDSSVAAYLINKIFSKSCEIKALLIDEGIKGYRDKSIEFAKKNCEEWNINYKVIKFEEEYGTTMGKIQKMIMKDHSLGNPCSFCGIMRRQLMNKYARTVKADKLVTGHNLDDECQSILMNVCDNKPELFVRLGPKSGIIKTSEFVTRVKPLYEISENEVFAYANFAGIKYYGGECCPLSHKAKRNEYRETINRLEKAYPGTKYSTINFFERIKNMLKKDAYSEFRLKQCELCSEPCSTGICKVCEKLNAIRK
ncbi:MAG: TIGR00269 family protein [Candidatus Diapherotrites archaeon CG08_land_8_20_14_0_20_34_12]|nr:MAG: TIGR00269 family protein [Candidatus Diapherotrites archaeon CG08_land_8_20_14_0_20_34_12]